MKLLAGLILLVLVASIFGDVLPRTIQENAHSENHYSCLSQFIRCVLNRHTTALQEPASILCTRTSPTGPPVWSGGNPPVEMRHIFCGEIYNNRADGFHSDNPATKWNECVVTEGCKTFGDGSGYCEGVFIYDSRNGVYERKQSGSTLWPKSLSPARLVQMFQTLYGRCPPAVANNALCFSDCRWAGNANAFDIVIGTGTATIVTAYPAQQGTCSKHPGWQDCGSQDCQNL